MSEEFLSDMEGYFDSLYNEEPEDEAFQNNEQVEVIKSNTQSNLDLFYAKLEAEGLNLDELKGILECKDTLLVLSGAGAGKTTMLILKIIRDLLAGDTMKVTEVNGVHGVNKVVMPANILVSTFLKSGAEELQASFRDWCKRLGITGIDYSTIKFRTIHAEVRDALMQMGVRVDILDNSTDLLRKVMHRYNVKSVQSNRRGITADDISDVASIISYARNRLDDKKYSHSLMDEYALNTLVLDALLKDYAELRAATGKLDFEDMQELILQGAKTNPNVAQFLANRYDYIYVDEFQDTSQLQYEVLKYYFNGAKRVLVIGDDRQCLVEGTMVDTIDGLKPIKDICIGDLVRSGIGRGKTDYFTVDNISKRFVNEDIVVIKTESGKEIRGTKNHIGFARLIPDEDTYYVYLMYKESVGFRIDQTRGVRTEPRNKIKNATLVGVNQEKADKAWLLYKTNSKEEATFWESYYSYNYNIPQYTFRDCSGEGGLTFKAIQDLYETEPNGYKLLYDLGLDPDYPHFISQADSARHKLNFSMLTSSRVNIKGVHKSELSASTSNEDFVAVLEHFLPVTIKKATLSGDPYYNARSSTGFIDSEMDTIKEIKQMCKDRGIYLEVNMDAKFNDEKYNFMPFGNFIEGMYIPVLDGDKVVEERVVSVTKEPYEGYVYDMSVPATRNFVAEDILVHNCIYSWRGSDVNIISNRFEEDFNPTIKQLTTNYRCRQNILNAVIPSIEKNTTKHPMKLRASKEGGQVNIIYDNDVHHLLESIKQDLIDNRKIGVIARTNADLLIPTILLELDNTVDFALSKSVSLNNRLPRQVFGIMDLVTKRFTNEFEGYLKLFLPRYAQYEAEKIDSILRLNKDKNLYNIPMEDIQYSTPNLAYFIKGLRSAKEQDDVIAYLYILGVLEKRGYVGKTVYAQSAREFIRYITKIILEHKSVKKLSLSQIDTLFNEVLPERIARRIKYGKGTFLKLTTVHDAKGKEWDSVYIWNDIRGNFPNVVGNRALTQEEFEEERRVHYIAWTRAKDKLTVYTQTNCEGTFLKECDLSVPDVIVSSNEDSKTDFKLVRRSKQENEASEDRVGADTLLRSYVTDMLLGGKITDSKVANIEIVLNKYDFESLVERLDSEYGTSIDDTNYKDYFEDFFSRLADEVFNEGLV